MNYYLRLVGAVLVGVGAILILRGYERYLNRRLEEYRGLISLVSHAEGEISKFLTYGSELFRNFTCPTLERCGLMSAIAEEGGLYSAFIKCRERMSLSSRAKEKIASMLSTLGTGYREGELVLLSEVREQLAAELAAEEVNVEKNISVARALLIGGGLVAVIMAL